MILFLLPSVIALKQGETTIIDVNENKYAVYFVGGNTMEDIEFELTNLVETEPLANEETILKQDEQSCYFISIISENVETDLRVSKCESFVELENGEIITTYPFPGQEFCISAEYYELDEVILKNLNVPSDCLIEIVCGNGFIELNEKCDDGNQMDGDGCSSKCMKENDAEEDEQEVQEKAVLIDGVCYKLNSEQSNAGLNIKVNLVDESFCDSSPGPDSDSDPDPGQNPGGSSPGGSSPGGSSPGGSSPSSTMSGVPLVVSKKQQTTKSVIPKQQPIIQKTQQATSSQLKSQTKQEVTPIIESPMPVDEISWLNKISLSSLIIFIAVLIICIGLVVSYVFYKHKHSAKFRQKFVNNLKRLGFKQIPLLGKVKTSPDIQTTPPPVPKLPAKYQQQLRTYINLNVRKGLTNDEIIFNLTKAGWRKEDIIKIITKDSN